MRIRSLNQRLALYLLFPVALTLFLTGFIGFIFARNIMLNEWREAAILRLQRAAHHIDMRLSTTMEWMDMFHRTGGYRGGFVIQEWILDQLERLEGVTKVDLEWLDNKTQAMPMHGQSSMGRRRMMSFHQARISEVTPPVYDAETKEETVTLISVLKDESGELVGRLKVSVRFDYLMKDVIQLGWWQSDMACLVEKSGRYLTHTETRMNMRSRLGETDDPLELAVLENMQEKPFGTILGSGHPPHMVSGFYTLKGAPWTIVLFAPGARILSPILRFRLYYALGGGLAILFIILLIRLFGGRMVNSIKEISSAAEKVAKGDYGKPLPVKSADEIGQLVKSFNLMVDGLKERDFVSNTFGRYVDPEIARELMRRPEASRLGGQKREVAMLMSDIRGFTSLSESLSPEGTISVLNHYFAHMISVIKQYKGIIVDFFGDSVLVFFDPLDGPIEHVALRSVRCALHMQGMMDKFNAEMKADGLPEFQMGIGVNVGKVVVGNIGSESRAKYGIVGSAVNVTQRIQTVARGKDVVISEAVYEYLAKQVLVEKSFTAQLKGVEEGVKLHLIKGLGHNRDSSFFNTA